MSRFFTRYKEYLWFGGAIALLLVVLQLLQYRLLLVHQSWELYIAAIALVFTLLGIWLANKLTSPRERTIIKEIIVEKEVGATPALAGDSIAATDTGLSSREMDVLRLMAEGLSNQEIADRLFVSLNTVKTHSSRIFEKLDVKRRTQAIETARRLHLIQ